MKTKAMAYQIELENDKKMTVSIEKSLDQENFTGISSMNADGFVLRRVQR